MELHEDAGILSHVVGHQIFILVEHLDQELQEIVQLVVADIDLQGVEVVNYPVFSGSSQSIGLFTH